MAPSRRRSRSPKLVAATTLLTLAAVVASAALTTSAVPALAGATVLAVLAGMAAAMLMFAEIVVIRRMWAFDRAQSADRYRADTMLRHDSHMTFVLGMGSRLAWREQQMGLMQDALLTSEIDTALAREKLSAEKGRVAALQEDNAAAATDLASARADLLAAQDALAASESAGMAARAEIIAWEETAESAAEQIHQRHLA
ncbi:MAG: hypothetical protein WB508_06200 [Aeromicrobium sp.]|uniref:hypothetical protein n=1 Tax=Aeromicrobium sp. TaxID=1871063 RepID=UPI003C68C780